MKSQDCKPSEPSSWKAIKSVILAIRGEGSADPINDLVGAKPARESWNERKRQKGIGTKTFSKGRYKTAPQRYKKVVALDVMRNHRLSNNMIQCRLIRQYPLAMSIA